MDWNIIYTVVITSNVLTYPYSWAPGAIDPTCTKEEVCVSGYTQTVRPDVTYTNKLKRIQIQFHPEIDCSRGCEEDHVIPLELCGDPKNPRNLSPQPYEPKPGAHEKDRVENWLHKQVCSDQMTLEQAQRGIQNWQEIYVIQGL